ncbi:hypothetical protein GGI07_000817 [Coemansia sp. Benny D115]|nr:hypothetical protein GGI07_000817 [Coemansia sp. Benny D115]
MATLSAREHDLEATIAQLRDQLLHAQKASERLERDHHHTAAELAALTKAHERLEAQFFATETELATTRARLDRAQRTAAALEKSLDSHAQVLEREREQWQKRELELTNDLAAAKRRATVTRRQTVSNAPPPMQHRAGGHSRSMSMFAHDLPAPAPAPAPVSPLGAARTLTRQRVTEDPDDSGASDARGSADKEGPAQVQVRQLSRRLKDAESRAQSASEHALRMQAEAQHTVALLDALQQRSEDLKHTVAQLTELNESLREDNESYQMLLQMGTMKGGLSFATNPQRASMESRASSANQTVAAESSAPGAARPRVLPENPRDASDPAGADGSSASGTFALQVQGSGALDLASELGNVLSSGPLDGSSSCSSSSPANASAHPVSRIEQLEEQSTQLREELRRTKFERRQLAEENKALSIYVNKILARILTSPEGLEAVLSRDYESPQQKRQASATASSPGGGVSLLDKHSVPSAAPMVSQSLSPASSRSSSSKALPRPSVSTRFFAEPGSGDGITSVFVPPTSPTMRVAQPVSPMSQSQPQPQPQSPPPYTRRTRSATVAVDTTGSRGSNSNDGGGQADADIKDSGGPSSGSIAAAATVGARASSAGGTWWKRMSMLRLGSSAWSPPESHPE